MFIWSTPLPLHTGTKWGIRSPRVASTAVGPPFLITGKGPTFSSAPDIPLTVTEFSFSTLKQLKLVPPVGRVLIHRKFPSLEYLMTNRSFGVSGLNRCPDTSMESLKWPPT